MPLKLFTAIGHKLPLDCKEVIIVLGEVLSK